MKCTQLGQKDLRASTIAYGTWQFGGDWGSFEAREAQAAIRRARVGHHSFRYCPGLRIRHLRTGSWGGTQAGATDPAREAHHRHQRRATHGGQYTLARRERGLATAGCRAEPAQPRRRLYRPLSGALASALAQLMEEGKIRYVGVSNYDVAQMQEFERTRKIDTLQPPYHLFRRDIERDILPYCQENSIGVLVYGPIAHGLLAGGYTPQTTFASDDWRSKSSEFQGEPFVRNLAVAERLEEVAKPQGISVEQLAIAWVLANPAVDVAIVGARRPQQLEQTALAADIHLTPETRGEIEQIMREAAPVGGPSPEGM